MDATEGDSNRVFPPGQSERDSQRLLLECYEECLAAARRAGEYVPAQPAPRSGGEAAAAFNLSIEQSCNSDSDAAAEYEDWKASEYRENPPLITSELEVRARRCKCGVCPTCAASVAYRESQRVKAVMAEWKFPQMWTLTLNPRAYPDQRRILEYIKEKRSVSTWIQSLWRKGVLETRDFYVVMEFQDGSRNAHGVGTEEVHFHVLLNTKGFIDWSLAWELWESKAAPWRECGEPMNKHCPAMGFVRFDKVYEGKGLVEYLSKGVAGYLAKGPKNLPGWFVQYLDDGHNMQLKYPSRGFFKSLPKPEPKYKRKPSPAKARKRRKVSERIAACKHDADGYVVVNGKPVWVDRSAWDWETSLAIVGKRLTAEQLEQAQSVGRVRVTADEFLRVCGLDGYRAMVERAGGVAVGLGQFTETELYFLQRHGLPAYQVPEEMS